MNRVNILLANHTDRITSLVGQGQLTRERADAILAGNAKITKAEAQLVADACAPAFTAELLLLLQKDDLTTTSAEKTTAKSKEPKSTGASPKSSSRPYGRYHTTTPEF